MKKYQPNPIPTGLKVAVGAIAAVVLGLGLYEATKKPAGLTSGGGAPPTGGGPPPSGSLPPPSGSTTPPSSLNTSISNIAAIQAAQAAQQVAAAQAARAAAFAAIARYQSEVAQLVNALHGEVAPLMVIGAPYGFLIQTSSPHTLQDDFRAAGITTAHIAATPDPSTFSGYFIWQGPNSAPTPQVQNITWVSLVPGLTPVPPDPT